MRIFEGFQHGINLGGWLSQADDITKEHYDSYIAEQDIEYIASLGLDHVRVPVDYFVLEEEDGTVKEDGYVCFDNCLKWCKKHNLRMIIDLHATYGYNFDPLVKSDKVEFFDNKDMQERFYSLWRTIATRYGKDSKWVAFELLNEIIEPEVAEGWNKVVEKTIKEIRELAPDSWIIFGGTRYNSVVSVPDLVDPKDDKVVYTFHCYEPLIFTHQGAYWVDNMPSEFRLEYPLDIEEYKKASLIISENQSVTIFENEYKDVESSYFETIFKEAISVADERNVPLYCGEYGVIDLADNESKIRWTATMKEVLDKYNIGRAYWNYKGKDFGVVDIEDVEIQKRLAKQL